MKMGELHALLSLDLNGGEWLAWSINCFTPLYPTGMGFMYPLDRKVGRLPSRSGQCGEEKSPTPVMNWIHIPRSSTRSTDWDIPAPYQCPTNSSCLIIIIIIIKRRNSLEISAPAHICLLIFVKLSSNYINLLETQILLNSIWKASSYLTGNTLRLRYKAQPVNAALLWEICETHKYTLYTRYRGSVY
jgi:hypothetical protein